MTNNIELIGIQSNKIDKSETEIIKRIMMHVLNLKAKMKL